MLVDDDGRTSEASNSLLDSQVTQNEKTKGVIRQNQEEPAPEQVSLIKFFSYITLYDKLLLFIGSISAIAAGAILPSVSLIMGNVANAFTGGGGSSGSSGGDIISNMSYIASYVILIAMSLFIFSYLFFAFWQHLAENIVTDLRRRYIFALMRQEIAYFEKNKVEELPAQISEVFETVKASIGEQISNLAFAVATVIAGIVYAISFGPTFALICLTYLPVLLGIIGVFGSMVRRFTMQKLAVIKHLGGIAEETLTAIKVVAGFGREDRELQKFAQWSRRTQRVTKKSTFMYSFMVGIMKFAIFGFYAFSFYIGSTLVENKTINSKTGEPYSQKDVLSVLIALITGFVGLIAALPNVQSLMAAKTLGALIFQVIERVPEIRNNERVRRGMGLTLKKEIEFRNVTFKYPTAPEEHKPVLENATFKIKAGTTTAIVGPSGSGKSTIIQLVERFYDPQDAGQICFDGVDLRDIDLKDLREQVGYVSQEPIMIMGTIRDNLLYGDKDASERDCREALERASASFVFEQENGMDTFVGTSGIMNMSGGQKQRIAIARALIKRPKILILDEATSALDPKSEVEVQNAIDQIARNGEKLTIIMIAHRLTTIASADNLLYFKSRSQLVSASKGSAEYDEIWEKIKCIQYAMGDEEKDGQGDEDDEQEIIEEEEYSSDDEIQRVQTDIAGTKEMPTGQDEDENQLIMPNSRNDSIQSTEGNMADAISKRLEASKRERLLSDNQIVQSQSQYVTPVQQKRRVSQMSKRKLSTKSNPKTQSQRSQSEMSMVSTASMHRDGTRIRPQYREVPLKEMMKYYTPRWMAVVGLFASVVSAFQLPMFGYILSQFVFVLALPLNTPDQIADFSHQRNVWTWAFIGLVIGIGLSTFVQKLCFGFGGDNLTLKLRIKLFESILRKHIGWFDNKERAPGILTNIITEDISAVNGLTTEAIGILIEAFLGITISCLICFIFSWQLAIVVTLISPFMVLGGLGMAKLQFNQEAVDDSYKQANSLLSDIILNYRTVIAFGPKNVDMILERYSQLLVIPREAGIKKAHISGLFFGYSQGIRFVFIGLVFYIAAVFTKRYDLDSQQVYAGCYVVFVGSIGTGVSLSQLPSITKAREAAKLIFGIIEEPSKIDPKQSGQKNISHGRVEFKNIWFRYPSRKRAVLRNFNLTIEPNQSVAIVGHSGSGKSTIASLILRFYDSVRGQIVIDGQDLKKMDVPYLRDQISIVQQEPLLFNETIKQNIMFGNLKASDPEIRTCATQANAMGFIMQSEDDISSPAVQARLRDQFNAAFNTLIGRQGSSAYPHFSSIIGLVEANTLSYKELAAISDLMPNLSQNGLDSIENNFKNFLDAVNVKSQQADVTWQAVLKCFLFQPEAERINSYLNEHGNQWPLERRREVRLASQMNDCQFDVQTVIDYLQKERSTSALNSDPDDNFQFFIRMKSRTRVEEQYRTMYEDLIDMEKVRQAELQLHPGFSKICGLKGSKLSGGQKQRVAIARALIKDPKILILDEATSALDEQSQEIVQQALDRAMEGRTSIVIAHRMSTIQKCNRIVVVHKGKVVEDGTFEELSEKPDGHFARLKAGIA